MSFAGKRAGIDGERSGLWSEYVRAIRALRPQYVIVENVPGLLTNEYMGRVLGGLAQSGYDAEWDCLPASAFGAPHLRQRIFLCAYPIGRYGENRILEDCESYQERRYTRLGEFGGMARPETWLKTMPFYARSDDGLPNRVERLQSLKNAIVPQIAEWLGRQIMKVRE